jgi:hypothetical protein
MMNQQIIDKAHQILDDSILYYKGKPVGTVAARDPEAPAALNYNDCFIRDFIPSALVFLTDGRTDIVHNFLETVLHLRTHERTISGHEIQPGVMPASFRVKYIEGKEALVADFGERAIGRVAPVDSMMWWTILLYIYEQVSGDTSLSQRDECQHAMQQILHLCLKDSFEVSPALLVPDACSMIDRRMGIYGHPLEIQALFFGMLRIIHSMLKEPPKAHGRRAGDSGTPLVTTALNRENALRNYVRLFYWLDLERLNEIHRYRTEEIGRNIINVLNIYPESIPTWLVNWLADDSGYLVGNIGTGRIDFRYFALGNLLAVLFGLSTDLQSEQLMRLYEQRWDDLVGAMPVKILYPTVSGNEWEIRTGCDPKNVPWSYHNGGNWPALLWYFVAAAMKSGRGDLAERAYNVAENRLLDDHWPEYYDGEDGRLIGRRANLNQTWSATSLIMASRIIRQPELVDLFPS